VVFPRRLEMDALTFVAVFPPTGLGTPGMVVPYKVFKPYSKVTAVLAPLAVTVPVNVAFVVVTPVAAVVTTVGARAGVVKVRSPPFTVPPIFAPLTLKW
jgi:hypothetical protein